MTATVFYSTISIEIKKSFLSLYVKLFWPKRVGFDLNKKNM